MAPGDTPLVELSNLAPSGTRLFAKLEWYNPTGSVKDRSAWYMFHNALELGLLHKNRPLIEATSGNTGIGLARLAIIYGYRIIIALPSTSTEERKQMLRAYGAELIEVNGGPNDCIEFVNKLVAEGEGHSCYQYGNRWNPYSHFLGTSLEIINQWPLRVPPAHLIAAYGTGGTLTGNSRGLRLQWPSIAIHSVEEDLGDTIGGMRSQEDPFQPPIADLSLVTDRTVITRTEAELTVAEIMSAEGHFAGTSSGAVIRAAQKILERDGGNGVALLPDAGWKYLSGRPWS